jgi:GNAT superfamily N-acetyltransferase
MAVTEKLPAQASFTIRTATEADVPVVLELIRGLAGYVNMSDSVVTDEATLRHSLFGDKPSAEVILGCVDGEAVGFAVFFENFSTFLGRKGLYLEDLFIQPEHRSRGYGKALLNHLAREANRRGCGRFEWIVLEWNQLAIDFYKKMGAEIQSEPRICRLSGEALRNYGTED